MTASTATAIPARPAIHWTALRAGSSASTPSGFVGSGCPERSLTSTDPARNIDATMPTPKSTTIAYGSHRHLDDAADPVGESAMSRVTAPTGTRKMNVWSQTAKEGKGSPPGFV